MKVHCWQCGQNFNVLEERLKRRGVHCTECGLVHWQGKGENNSIRSYVAKDTKGRFLRAGPLPKRRKP